MSNTSIIQALSGPVLAKLALALLAGLFFTLLRRKETEGILSRFLALVAFLLVRDILFVFLPYADIFRASDLVVLGALAYISLSPHGGLALWASLAASLVALVLLGAKALFGLAPGFPSEILRYISLAPITVAALSRVGSEDNAHPQALVNAPVDDVAARVVKVLDNGNLLIEGRRSLVVNTETQNITISGVVRPQDVTAANTVLSSQIADAEVQMEGDGLLAEAQRPGILYRILDWLGLF